MRMDDPEMKDIPKIEGRDIVDPFCLQEGPEYSCYKVIDKEKLMKIHRDYANFEITDLVHSTSLDNFVSIIKKGMITPGREKPIWGLYKDNPLREESFRMSWWGLSFNKKIP